MAANDQGEQIDLNSEDMSEEYTTEQMNQEKGEKGGQTQEQGGLKEQNQNEDPLLEMGEE